jgi:putative Holliday junction resolvase
VNVVGRIVAIDYGSKRTGIAVTDPSRMIASPLETVPTHQLMDFLASYMKKEEVDLLVVGEPKQMDASDSESFKQIRYFTEAFGKRFPGMPVKWVDERFTSRLAMSAMIEGGMKKSRRRVRKNVDKISAAIILQTYLEGKNKPPG